MREELRQKWIDEQDKLKKCVWCVCVCVCVCVCGVCVCVCVCVWCVCDSVALC